jgi:hypothetical protein
MVNSGLCEKIVKIAQAEEGERLCCGKEKCENNPIVCPKEDFLVRCHQIGKNLEACRRNDKSAMEVCKEENYDKLFCLSLYHTLANS